MTMPIETYKDQIKILFAERWKTLTSAEIAEYFETGEVKELLEERYQLFLKPEHILHGTGSISSVVHCLEMMY
jgi:uncharacterized membrane protein YukC